MDEYQAEEDIGPQSKDDCRCRYKMGRECLSVLVNIQSEDDAGSVMYRNVSLVKIILNAV